MSITSLKSGRARLLGSTGLAVAGAMFVSTAAFAQDTQTMETVVITGSRIPTVSAFDSSTPVTIVGAEEIQLTGTSNISSLLDSTPGFVASRQGSGYSNNVQGGGFSGATFANLRGLNTSQSTYDTVRSLVLVNGRRYTVQSAYLITDMNTIPADLVDRTEVVTGGSSAVYGSDAIAGVINFVTKQNFTGVKASVHLNFDEETTTPAYSVDLTAGANFDHDKGNVAVALDYYNRGSIQRSEVPYAFYNTQAGCTSSVNYHNISTWDAGHATSNCPAGEKLGLVATGSGDTPAGHFALVDAAMLPGGAKAPGVGNALYDAWIAAGFTSAAGPNQLTSQGFTFGGAGARPWVNGFTDGLGQTGDRFNTTGQNYLQIPQERWMINAFMHYDIAPKVTAYAEMHFSNNSVVMHLTPTNNNAVLLLNTNNPYLSPQMQAVLTQIDKLEPAQTCSGWRFAGTNLNPNITPNTAIFPCTTTNDGIAAVNLGRRFVEIGDRNDHTERVAWRFAGGFKGALGDVSPDYLKDLSYDISYQMAQTNETDTLTGVVSKSKTQQAVLSVGGAAPVCNLFGTNISAQCRDAIAITDIFTVMTRQAGAVAALNGTAFDLPAGPLQFAMGGEWRSASTNYQPDQKMMEGDIAGFNTSQPTKGGLTVHEAFGEIRVPVVKDLPLVELFTANAAFRVSSYNLKGTGTVWTYTAGGDWKVVEGLSFRGQYDKAIRAPNTGELYSGAAVNFGNAVDPCGPLQPVASQTAAVAAACHAQAPVAFPNASGAGGNLWQPIVQQSNLVGSVSSGNPLLGPETSDTITFGTVFMPEFLPRFGLSVDWYSISVKGAIGSYIGGVGGVLASCFGGTTPSACSLINRDPATGAISGPTYVTTPLANLGGVKTQGLDIGIVYAYDANFGLLTDSSTFNLGSNWTKQFESRSFGDPTHPERWQECIGSFGNSCGEPNPALKGTTRVTWHDGPLALSLRWRYIGGVTDDRFLINTRNPNAGSLTPLANIAFPYIAARHYFDLSFSYDFTENLQASGGINNIFALTPPLTSAGNNYGNTFPATYDPLGRSFFLNLVAKTN